MGICPYRSKKRIIIKRVYDILTMFVNFDQFSTKTMAILFKRNIIITICGYICSKIVEVKHANIFSIWGQKDF
jgi:hypothetical protein